MQSWNNLINYIKRKLGAPLNLLEYSDEEIKEIIQEDVLPELSQTIAKPIWLMLNESDYCGLDRNDPDHAIGMYEIKVPENITLVDVLSCYFGRDTMGFLGLYRNMLAVLDPRDVVMTNTFLDTIQSLDVIQTFTYVAPNKIYFDREVYKFPIILECRAVHSNLDTFPAGIYHNYVKPLALAEIMEDIAAKRKKYRSISTPFGELNLNADEYKAEADRLRQIVQERIDSTPPDHLIHIF